MPATFPPQPCLGQQLFESSCEPEAKCSNAESPQQDPADTILPNLINSKLIEAVRCISDIEPAWLRVSALAQDLGMLMTRLCRLYDLTHYDPLLAEPGPQTRFTA